MDLLNLTNVKNMLRKTLWFNYAYYQALGEHEFVNEGKVFQAYMSKSQLYSDEVL